MILTEQEIRKLQTQHPTENNPDAGSSLMFTAHPQLKLGDLPPGSRCRLSGFACPAEELIHTGWREDGYINLQNNTGRLVVIASASHPLARVFKMGEV